MRKRISDSRLYVGSAEDCAAVAGNPDWAVVHACKYPCHAGKCGPKVAKDAANYLAYREEDQLFLNMIDPPVPMFPMGIFDAFLGFMDEVWQGKKNVLIHCNKGESRAPSLALLFLAKRQFRISNLSYDDAWDDFEQLMGERYTPSTGIEEWLREHWGEIPSLAGAKKGPATMNAPGMPSFRIPENTGELKRMVMDGTLLHFAAFCEIENKEHVWQKPIPNAMQFAIDEAYHWCMENGVPCRLMNLKPRQVGSSTKFGHLCYHHMRRFKSDMLVMGDVAKRTEKVYQMFCDFATHDSFPWDSKFSGNTIRANFFYADGSQGLVEHDTAMDPKAGISGTRQVLWMTEAARYKKTNGNDKKVITAVLNSLANVPRSLGIAESTPEGACYDGETELLTDHGWMFFKDLDGSEKILSKSRETGVAYYQDFWQPQVHHYKGPMVKIKARSVNLRVTPNHNMWIARQKGKMKMSTAKSMLNTTTDFYFDRGMTWKTEGISEFLLPSYRHRQGNGWRTLPERSIPIEDWLEYLGFWLADGHVTFLDGNKCCTLTQTKFVAEFRESARKIALYVGCKLRDVPHERGRRFIMDNAQLASYLVNFARPKRIPRNLLMEMNSAQCQILLRAIYLGDGDQDRQNRDSDCQQGKIYCGIDESFQNDCQELALKCGYATSAYGPKRNRVSTFTEQTRSALKTHNPPTLEEGYDGLVYCVTLPKDHLLMVRRGGVAVWCGNSGWFYDNWNGIEGKLGAVTLDQRKKGIVGNGWIKIFTPWFAFPEHCLIRSPLTEDYFGETLDERERRGIELYNWIAGQIAWRRMKIAKDCAGDENTFDQDFAEDAQSCFLASGRNRFDIKGITHLEKIAKVKHSLAERGVLESANEKPQTPWEVQFLPIHDGNTWLWCCERPVPGLSYIAGLDPCTGAQTEGSLYPDSHAAGIIRVGYRDEKDIWHNPRLVAAIDVPNGCRWPDEILGERMRLLTLWYGDCMVVPETGNGLGAISQLKQHGCSVYQRRKLDAIHPGKLLEIDGWLTNQDTRPLVVNEIALRIREQTIDCEYLTAVIEMTTFVVNSVGKAEAKSGCHDDWVLMLGIVLNCLSLAGVMPHPPAPFGLMRALQGVDGPLTIPGMS